MTPLERAEWDVHVQRNILWAQREGLRHALDPLGNRATPDEWRAWIAATKVRLRDAEARLAAVRKTMETTP